MNVFDKAINSSEQRTTTPLNHKVDQPQSLKKANDDEKPASETKVAVDNSQSKAPQLQTRNISFKRNEESKTMYVEITNEDNEVVRTIPADEKDPRFIELVAQSTPGMIINSRS